MQDSEYLTKDIGEAVALISMGQKLNTIHWKDATAFFSFPTSDDISRLSQEYYFGALSVPARIFYDNLRMLKRRIHTVSKPTFRR